MAAKSLRATRWRRSTPTPLPRFQWGMGSLPLTRPRGLASSVPMQRRTFVSALPPSPLLGAIPSSSPNRTPPPSSSSFTSSSSSSSSSLRQLKTKPRLVSTSSTTHCPTSASDGVITQRVRQLEGGNVFAEFSQLAAKHEAINLGQGFPSFSIPEFLSEAVDMAMKEGFHQYSRPGGNPMLVNAISEFYQPRYNRTIDPMANVVVCNGAQEGIFVAVTTLCEEGDEVIALEPYFDAYRKAATLVGAVTKGVPLRLSETKSANLQRSAAEYTLDLDELERAMSDRTRVLILNTPHNPTGKAFTREELEGVAELLKRYPRCLVFSDEVYEAMCYDGVRHERFATLDGMWERTITFFSAGKTFSCTGWRVGYMIGPQSLCLSLIKAQAVVAFCAATPLEVAIAKAFHLAEESGYFESLPAQLQNKRDSLVCGLENAGFSCLVPQGGYFIMANAEGVTLPGAALDSATPDTAETPLENRQDVKLAKFLTEEMRVTSIPPSPFYSPQNRHLARDMLRFCFCKKDDEIDLANERLAMMIK